MSEPIDHQCCMLRSAHLVASILVYALPQSRSLSDMSEVLKVTTPCTALHCSLAHSMLPR